MRGPNYFKRPPKSWPKTKLNSRRNERSPDRSPDTPGHPGGRMRRATGLAGGSLARLAKTRRRLRARGENLALAMALGRRRPGRFEIAEKECFAYPSHDLEGLAH